MRFKNYTTVNDLMFDNPHIRDANWIHAGDVINVSSRANIAPATPRSVPAMPPRKPAPPTPPTKAPKIVGLPGWPENSIVAGARKQVQKIEHTAMVLAQGQSVTQAQAAPVRDTITVEDANLTNFAKRHGTTWRAVFDVNKDKLSNPNYVTAGMSLRVPHKASQAASQAVTQAPAAARTSHARGSHKGPEGHK